MRNDNTFQYALSQAQLAIYLNSQGRCSDIVVGYWMDCVSIMIRTLSQTPETSALLNLPEA